MESWVCERALGIRPVVTAAETVLVTAVVVCQAIYNLHGLLAPPAVSQLPSCRRPTLPARNDSSYGTKYTARKALAWV